MMQDKILEPTLLIAKQCHRDMIFCAGGIADKAEHVQFQS